MEEKKKIHKLQFNIDNVLYDKWHTFLKNNESVFNTGQILFRYVVNNIELLTEQNENLISKDKAEIIRLEEENIELKKEIYRLQNQNNENVVDQLIDKLDDIKKEIDILEVLRSTEMLHNRINYKMPAPKSSSVYLEAKDIVENKATSDYENATSGYAKRENNPFTDINIR